VRQKTQEKSQASKESHQRPEGDAMTTFKKLLLFVPLLLVLVPSSASAATAAPGFTIDAFASPANFSPGDNAECLSQVSTVNGNEQPACDGYQVTATNAGSLASSAPTVIEDTVPAGLTVVGIRVDTLPFRSGGSLHEAEATCQQTGQKLVCTDEYGLAPDEELKLFVYVTVDESTPSGPLPPNTASVSGSGVREATISRQNSVSSTPAPFGAAGFNFFIDGANGERDTQAGDHPYELTTTIDLNDKLQPSAAKPEQTEAFSVEDPKDITVDLPLGFVGSILAAPQCTLAQLSSTTFNLCPSDTQVGFIHTEPESGSSVDSPIYNLTPERGVPAEFGYVDGLYTSHVFYVHVVPTPQGYVLQTTAPDIPQIALSSITVAFYGEPAVRDRTNNAKIPFFTNPTDCSGGPLVAKMYMDSWQNPGTYNADGSPNLSDPAWVTSESVSPPVTGCNALRFTPELSAQPTTHEADKPSGLNFELKVPQPEAAGVPATPTLKSVHVTLPEGFTVDPSAGDGLAACSEAQIGWAGGNPAGAGELQNFNAAAPACPEASKIGTLELETPLVPHKLTGELFLAAQNANPFGSTLAAYVVVNDPITGVLIKISGEFLPDPSTGRLTALFAENPNLPFSDLKLQFFGGPRAELATPEACGTFTTTTVLTPYSAPDSGLAATPFDSFLIDEACPGGFNPSFTAGSTNLQAGAYTSFEVSFSRQDTDQELQGLTVSLPPGLLADVGSVPLCGEAQANAGTCPESSQVGTVQTGVGPGPNPLFVGGKAYLTGPYNGGPYGLSVVVPAVAGPFNFGTVVVRQSIRISPTTAQVTDVSDPFPTIIDGIPLRLRRVDVTLNRPGFMFNPTDCGKLGFNGTISGSPLGSPRTLNGTIGYATEPGATSTFTTPQFQVTNCQSLKFQPKFSVSTAGHTSKALGASLTAKLTYPKTAQGTEANITRVKVDLPKQLPSQLKTLQKACTAKQFELNPANCPKESKIGYATVNTPILALPLSGPAIFVSHGNEAFPSLTMVLQGDGVTIDLVGLTLIKNGITSTTFKTVPDTPFSSFELKLAQGKYAALNSNLPEKDHGNLCGQNLKMPTEFLAQNGAKINQSTPISITGCKKAVKKTKKKHKQKSQHKAKKK
jgi:hypothetical protein